MGSFPNQHGRLIPSVLVATLVTLALSAAQSADAGTRLYTGRIQLRQSSQFVTYTYGIPIGANFTYPSLNNFPSGNVADTRSATPAAFALRANQMTLVTSLSTSVLPTSWVATFARTNFSGANDAGAFSVGSGPGNASSSPLTSLPGSQFGATFTASPDQFGGTMRMLGYFESLYSYNGGGGQSCYSKGALSGCPVRVSLSAIGGPFGGSAKHTRYLGGTGAQFTFFRETVWGFPWTTGTVMAVAPASTASGAPTIASLTAMGSDQRTSHGDGPIQLVTPFVVRRSVDHWIAGRWVSYRAGIAMMTLRFVPEPIHWIQLASGLLVLVGFYRFSHRKKRH